MTFAAPAQPKTIPRVAPLKGRCLFAAEPVRQGELIEAAPVVIFSADEARLIDRTPLFDYYFRWEGDINDGGSGAIAFGLVSLCSHSPRPNAIVRPNYRDNTLELYATVDITTGEEITIRYCSLWFEPALP